MPEALLRCTGAACAVLGDGETVFPALLRALKNGAGFETVPRLGWLEGTYRRVPRSAVNSIILLTPDLRLLDLKKYWGNLSAVPLQSKRGCPFLRLLHLRDQRRAGVPSAAAGGGCRGGARLAALGCRDIEFVDNVFNAPYDHALAICHYLARNRPPVRLQTLELNPAFVDDRLLGAMAQAGFVGMGVTVENAADPALAGMKKGFTADVEGAAAAIRRSPLPCFWIFLLGGPGETKATVAETIRFARRTLRPGDVAYINVGIRIYPGTELENIARRQGLLNCSADEMLKPAFYFSPELDYALDPGPGAPGRRRPPEYLACGLPEPPLAAGGQPPVQPAAGAPAPVAAYPGHPPGGPGPGPGYIKRWSVFSGRLKSSWVRVADSHFAHSASWLRDSNFSEGLMRPAYLPRRPPGRGRHRHPAL